MKNREESAIRTFNLRRESLNEDAGALNGRRPGVFSRVIQRLGAGLAHPGGERIGTSINFIPLRNICVPTIF